jgi:hypothetical protein
VAGALIIQAECGGGVKQKPRPGCRSGRGRLGRERRGCQPSRAATQVAGSAEVKWKAPAIGICREMSQCIVKLNENPGQVPLLTGVPSGCDEGGWAPTPSPKFKPTESPNVDVGKHELHPSRLVGVN